MDLATIIGLIGGTLLILMSVFFGPQPVIFFNLPGLSLLSGGIVAVTFIKFKMSDVTGAIDVGMKSFLVKIPPSEDIIQEMVGFTRIAKKEGLMALENQVASNPFAAKALRYLVDGYDASRIEDLLGKDIRLTVQRHTVGQNVLKGMGESAPAFGMIGTLIGLVQMLSAIDDPSRIGPAMAMALLTTLYGALMAFLIFLPLADKLGLRAEQERVNNSIIMEAAGGILRGVSPLVLEESLKLYLAPKQRQGERAAAEKGSVDATEVGS
jgi:chemotaxis protein MotA